MSRPAQKPNSRAEALRTKRQPHKGHLQYSQEQIKRSASQPARAAVSRAVTSRGVVNQRGNTSVPLRQRTQSSAKRQYTISLPTAGAELRLPISPNIHLGWRLISGALAFCVLAILVAMWNAPFFQVGLAKLSGANRLTAADINTVLKVEGMPVIQASPRGMEQDLKDAFPDLASVKVSVSIPAGVTVRVTERQPVIAWKVGDTVQWVDKDGFAFPARGDGGSLVAVDAQAAPKTATSAEILKAADISTTKSGSTSQAAAPTPFISVDMVNAILTLGPQLPQGTAIVYNPSYGLGWNDPNGWQVFFGKKLVDMDTKLTQYKTIVDELTKENIHPKLISVEFPRAPFYRLEQ
jgi:hypothetical protein